MRNSKKNLKILVLGIPGSPVDRGLHASTGANGSVLIRELSSHFDIVQAAKIKTHTHKNLVSFGLCYTLGIFRNKLDILRGLFILTAMP